MLRLVTFLFWLFIPSSLWAMEDTVIVLKTVPVNAFRTEEKTAGLRSEQIDSVSKVLRHFSNLSLLLAEQNLYLKSYGPSQLSALSLRGGSSYHTGLLWNGLNIIDPMTGNADMSLIRPFLFDRINIQYGGSSSVTGSGNLAGSLLLSNKHHFGKHLNIAAGGSYNTMENAVQNFSISAGTDKTSTIVKAFHENALNRYKFIQSGEQLVQQSAHSRQRGVTIDHARLIGSSAKLEALMWYQYADRMIAPGLHQRQNDANQKDEISRLALSYKRSGRTSVNIRSALTSDRIVYSDDMINTSNSKASSAIAEIDVKHQITNNHMIGVMGNQTFTFAETPDYNGKQRINRNWFNAYYNFISNDEKWNGSVSVRKEFTSIGDDPLTFTTGINHNGKYHSFRASVSKVHRNPTLNDLFWQPGGNKDLKAERGYSTEAGYRIDPGKYFFRDDSKQLTFDISVFGRRINEWIQWIPDGSFWSPHNIDQVFSRGIESVSTFAMARNKFSLSANVRTAYIISQREETRTANDPSLNKQLIYVPVYSSTGMLHLQYGKVGFRVTHLYNGYRYTATDHSSFLEPFQVINIDLTAALPLGKHTCSWSFSIQNLFNNDYSLVANRPQPRRYFETGIIIYLNNL